MVKQKYKTIRTNIIIIVFTIIIAATYTLSANAATGLTGKRSVGKIVFAGDTSVQDVIFDSADFDKLADVCR